MTTPLRSVSNGTQADHDVVSTAFERSQFAPGVTLNLNTFGWLSDSPKGLQEFSVSGEKNGAGLSISGFRHQASGNICFYVPKPAPTVMQRPLGQERVFPSEREVIVAFTRMNALGRGTVQMLTESLRIEPFGERFFCHTNARRIEASGLSDKVIVVAGVYDPVTKTMTPH